MRFECPQCGSMTSSSFSLEGGGYWKLYNRGGPWGCPTCRTRLDVKCSRCGCVGSSATFRGQKCPACGFEQPAAPFPVVGCLIVLALIALGVGAYLLFR